MWNRGTQIPKVNFEVPTNYLEVPASLECSWCELVRVYLDRTWHSARSETLEMTYEQNPQVALFSGPTGTKAFFLSMRGDHPEMLGAFTFPEDRAAAHIPARPTRTDIRLDSIKMDVQSWLAECSNHEACHRITDFSLPARVIELNPSNDPNHVRLLNCKGRKDNYATLSYCWGAPSAHVLTSATLEQYLRQIPWPSLPKTVRDAIMVARAAKMQYLWVDAVCIVQDDKQDKIHEIANMCDIYRNSYVTIVAGNADDASKGFLGQRVPPETSTVPFRIGPGNFGTVSLQLRPRDHEVKTEAIQRRAWSLQEQVLAQRVLYFGNQTLEFRCGAGKQNLECRSIWPRVSWNDEDENSLQRSMMRPLPWNKEDALRLWAGLVTNYSPRMATFASDRLQALAGIAHAFSSTLGPTYHAGLWDYGLHRQLSWFRPQGPQASRSKVHCAPSWSWASSRGKLIFLLPPYREYVVKQAQCTLASPELPYGAVTNGSITISGRHAYGQLVRFQGDLDFWTITFKEKDEHVHFIGDIKIEPTSSVNNLISVIFDTVEKMEQKHVLCFRLLGYGIGPLSGSWNGLVLEAVAQQTNTFRRIGYCIQPNPDKKIQTPSWTEGEVTII
jgi:hypothetical protein